MKLFGRNRKNKEELAAELIPEEQPEIKGSPVADTGELVLDIEGLDARPVEQTLQSLRGATKTLPDKKQIEEAITRTEEDAEKSVEAQIKEFVEAVKEDIEPVETPAPVSVEELADLINDAESAVEAEPVSEEKPEAEPASVEEPEAEPASEEEAEAEPASEEEAEAEPAPEEDTEAEPIPEEEAEEEPIPEEEAEEEPAPEDEPETTLSSVSYASVAQAMVNAKKEPTGRFERDAVDDETLLAELYALIGDSKPKTSDSAAGKETPAPVQTRPAPRPVARITQETLQAAPEEFAEVEEDTSGVPGWLKGVFILLISLLLSAMTFYAVASDVIGKIF